jgi:hypothetical protein
VNHGQRSAAIGIVVTFCFGALVCDPATAFLAGAIIAAAVLFVGGES